MNYSSPFVIKKMEFNPDNDTFILYGKDGEKYYAHIDYIENDNLYLAAFNMYDSMKKCRIKYSIYDNTNCLLEKTLVEKGCTIEDLKKKYSI